MLDRDAKFEIKMSFDFYDAWGSAMSLFFDVCDEMTRREIETPDCWGYVCGILGPEDPTCDTVTVMTDADLLLLGNILHRYTRNLRRLGRDY